VRDSEVLDYEEVHELMSLCGLQQEEGHWIVPSKLKSRKINAYLSLFSKEQQAWKEKEIARKKQDAR
jgi:hypothetical protein